MELGEELEERPEQHLCPGLRKGLWPPAQGCLGSSRGVRPALPRSLEPRGGVAEQEAAALQ